MKLLTPEFKHEDARRTLTQLITKDVKQINEYHAKKGATLGNHYHKVTDEYFHIVKGTIVYNDSQIINKGTTFVVPPLEKHSIYCMTDVTMLTFLTRPYKEGDTDIYE